MADSQVPWGVEALGGDDREAGVEDQAELVPGDDRRPDDPARRAAVHGRTRAGATVVEAAFEPLGVRFTPRGSRGGHCQGG